MTLNYSEPWFTNPMQIRENGPANYTITLPFGAPAVFRDDGGNFNKPGFKVLESKDEKSAGIRAPFAGDQGLGGALDLHWDGKVWRGDATISKPDQDDVKWNVTATFDSTGAGTVTWNAADSSEMTAITKAN